MLARGQAELSREWELLKEIPTSRAHGRFGIYEVKPMKVMPPRKKGKKIRRGWVAPKKRRKNARGESPHTPEFLRGCVGGGYKGGYFLFIP